MNFKYENFMSYLQIQSKRKEAGFVQKYYIERKSRSVIIQEMYINSYWYYYSLKKKVKRELKKYYEIIEFLKEEQGLNNRNSSQKKEK